MSKKKQRRLVVTREAAKFLGLSMRRVTALASSGVIWSTKVGPLNRAYDLDDLTEYRRRRDEARDAGTVCGAVPQGKVSPASKLVVADEPVLLTREAAKYLGVSMKHLRVLSYAGKLRTTKMGPASSAFFVSDLQRYKSEMAALRKAGRARGKKPGGFKPDQQF